MTIHLYNTLTRRKERLEPVVPGRIGLYVCGPTVYDDCHIGHARSQIVFDVIVRHLEMRGFAVTYVRNFTDVDDKIIQRAAELGESAETLAERYIAAFHRDMAALNVRRATLEPRATEYIEPMIAVIERLLAKQLAYTAGGDVFFRVSAFPDYGKLSGRRLADLQAGARVQVDARKEHPFDFALWKAAKPGEPAWPSPWGPGRPGWHIECTAMASRELGRTFDIHGGGQDLIFPHHENEIAQSEGAFGQGFVRYWMHNGFVNIDREKMSKSLGNFLLIKDVLKTHHPETVRLFLLSKHYRSPIDYNTDALAEAAAGMDKIYGTLQRLDAGRPADAGAERPDAAEPFWRRFGEAMDDDFNTARGIGVLFEAVREANRRLDAGKDPAAGGLRRQIRAMGGVLGLLTADPEAYAAARRRLGLHQGDVDPQEIEELLAERAAARRAKDWSTADRLRERLDRLNVVIEDRPDGTVWRVRS